MSLKNLLKSALKVEYILPASYRDGFVAFFEFSYQIFSSRIGDRYVALSFSAAEKDGAGRSCKAPQFLQHLPAVGRCGIDPQDLFSLPAVEGIENCPDPGREVLLRKLPAEGLHR